MNFIIIYNPMAGHDCHSLIAEIETALKSGGYNVILEETKYKGHSTEIARKYSNSEDNIIISCGGDGTIHEVANGMAKGSASLLPLPLGTGNDFCRKLYGKTDAKEIAKQFGLLSGNPTFIPKPADLISINDFWCINVMSVGFDVLVEIVGRKMISKFPFIGHMGYKLAIIPCLFMNTHFSLNLTCDSKAKKKGESDKINTDDFILFAVCNASYYGGGFLPAPDAMLNDGLLDVCIADGVNIFEIANLVPKYMKGTADKHKKVHTYHITEGKLSQKDSSEFILNCDGENYPVTEVDFKVVPDAIKICYLPTMATPEPEKPIPELV